MIFKKTLIVLLALFGFLFLMGEWVTDFYRLLFPLILLSAFWEKPRLALYDVFQKLDQRWRLSWTVAHLLMMTTMFTLTWALDILALNSSYVDFGHYVQLIHNYVFHGEPIYNFHTVDINYFQEHRSLSIFPLAWLYRIFPSPVTLGVYQAILAISPIWILLWWGRKKGISGLLLFSICFLFTLTYSFVKLMTWPYTTHILGVPLLILAYAAFDLNKRWLWWACLILMCFEKEDFGLIALAFSLIALSQWRHEKRWIFLSLIVSAVSVWGLSFKSANRGFAAVFGHYGNTPSELVFNILTKPSILLEAYLGPAGLIYLGFFVFASGLWTVRPSKTWLLMFPVLPVMAANCLGNSEMRSLTSYFSTLVNVGVYAVLVMTVAQLAKAGRKGYAVAILFFVLGAQFMLAGRTIPRDFRNSVKLYLETREEVKTLEPYLDLVNENKTLCCEREKCGSFSGRRFVYQLNYCFERPDLTSDSTTYLFDRTSSGTIPEPEKGFELLLRTERFGVYRKSVSTH